MFIPPMPWHFTVSYYSFHFIPFEFSSKRFNSMAAADYALPLPMPPRSCCGCDCLCDCVIIYDLAYDEFQKIKQFSHF